VLHLDPKPGKSISGSTSADHLKPMVAVVPTWDERIAS
jgi:hypothetical protein